MTNRATVQPAATAPTRDDRPWRTLVVHAALLAIAFFGTAWLCRALAFHGGPFVNFWLPNGLYLATLLHHPRRRWPLLILAAGVANLAFDLSNGQPGAVCLAFATANGLEVVIGALLFEQLRGRQAGLVSLADVTALIVTAVAAPLIGASVGASAVVTLHGAGDFAGAWVTWWSGDVVGIMLAAPLLLAWSGRRGLPAQAWLGQVRLEVAIGVLLANATALIAFRHDLHGEYEIAYLVVPFVVWAGIRWGQRGAALMALNLALIATALATHTDASGALTHAALAPAQAVSLQLLLATVAGVGLFAAGLTAESRRAAHEHQTLLATSIDGLWIANLGGYLLEVNDAYCQMSGYRRDELVGMHTSELDALESPDETAGHIAEVVARGRGHFESQHRTKAGAIIDVEVNVVYTEERGGSLFVTARNITEAKRQVDRLRASEARHRSLFENAPIPVWEEDFSRVKAALDELRRDGVEDLDTYLAERPGEVQRLAAAVQILDVNQPSLGYFGVPSKTKLLGNLDRYFDAESLPAFRRELVALAAGETTFETELPIVDLAGDRRYVALKLAVVPGCEASLERVYVSFHDTTERRRAEVKLARELAIQTNLSAVGRELIRLRTVGIEACAQRVLASAMEITSSPDGCVTERDAATGAAVARAIHGSAAETMRAGDADAGAGTDLSGPAGQTWCQRLADQVPVVRNAPDPDDPTDEPALPARLLAVPVVAGTERVGLIVVANGERAYDDDDRRAVERLADLYAVAVLTSREIEARRILEENARQVQRLEALGRLAGGLAHEMNNVLGVVLGLATYLDMELHGQPALQEDVRAVTDAARRGKHLVEDLLQLARAGGRDKERTSVQKLIEKLLSVLEHTLSKDLIIATKVPAETLWIDCNRTVISQTLLNLALNAADAVGGSGRITVTAQVTGDGSGKPERRWVELSVSDDGCGMSAEVRERCLEPFFTTKDIGRGSGLGLALASSAVQSHDGSLTIDSVEGQGTTVTLTLPLAPARAESEVEASATPVLDLPPASILVVDDEEMARITAQRLLSAAGHRVHAVGSGQAALDHCAAGADDLDVVLLDLAMPEMDGAECFARLRERYPDLKVLFCTGHAGRAQAAALRAAGATGVIFKPLEYGELVRAVGQALGHLEGDAEEVGG